MNHHGRLRVGVAGLGRGLGLAAVFHHHPGSELVATCDPDPAQRGRAVQQFPAMQTLESFEQLLALELDLIVVATPPEMHVPQSIAALQAGRHVLCEVPAAVKVEECGALRAAALQGAGRYMMVENVLWFPRTRAWKKMLDAGDLGAVFYGEAEYLHDCRGIMRDAEGRPTWRAFLPPIHYIVHSLGPLLHWTCDRCVRVTALHSGSRLLPEFGTLAMESALIQTASGAVFKVLCGFALEREPALHYYSLYGTGGALESSRVPGEADRLFLARERQAGLQPLPPSYPEPQLPPEAQAGGHGASEWLMIDALLTALRDGLPLPGDVDRALRVTLPGLCAHQSALQGGAPVEVPDPAELGEA